MELDLRIGCAFTRFQTKSFQSKYTGLNNSVISYGPCQTPTLGFCVQRHDEIMAFKSEKYWKLALKVRQGPVVVGLEWCADGVFDQEVGHLLLSMVRDHTHTQVVGVTEKPRSKTPPTALNTVELLRVASSRLNIGPKATMDMAERLYIEGFISYPRTETTAYPKGFDFRFILSDLKRHSEFGEYTATLLDTGYKVPGSGHDAGDHPPITPMRSASRGQMRDSDWRLYDYITRRFLATVINEVQPVMRKGRPDYQGFISYPRTETTAYPKGFDFRSILSDLKRHSEFGEYSATLLDTGYKVPGSGHDASDHPPPITPMRSASRGQMRDSDWRLYDYITRRFLATLSPDCQYRQTRVEVSLGRERFSWSGLTPVSPGYTAIYTWHAVESDESAVVFTSGQSLEVAQVPNVPEVTGKYTGCWQCDQLLSELVTPFDSRTNRPRPRHTGGRRGRGRRGRGRGRGRK